MTPMLRQNLTLCVLVLIGINMRPLLTSIGPLLPDIRAASGMSYTLVALLTALPVIDPNGVLVGEITRRMILHFLVQNL